MIYHTSKKMKPRKKSKRMKSRKKSKRMKSQRKKSRKKSKRMKSQRMKSRKKSKRMKSQRKKSKRKKSRKKSKRKKSRAFLKAGTIDSDLDVFLDYDGKDTNMEALATRMEENDDKLLAIDKLVDNFPIQTIVSTLPWNDCNNIDIDNVANHPKLCMNQTCTNVATNTCGKHNMVLNKKYKNKIGVKNRMIICVHNKRRTRCKDCPGGSVCEHGRIRYSCKECKQVKLNTL